MNRQPQFTERTILSPLWRENARRQFSQHMKPCDDHSAPRPCGWNHQRITILMLILLNYAITLAILAVWP